MQARMLAAFLVAVLGLVTSPASEKLYRKRIQAAVLTVGRPHREDAARMMCYPGGPRHGDGGDGDEEPTVRYCTPEVEAAAAAATKLLALLV